jgi:hypothetical protein
MPTATVEFDPSVPMAEDAVGLTAKECRAVLAYYKMPPAPAKSKVSDLRKFAAAAIASAKGEAIALPNGDPAPEAPTVDEADTAAEAEAENLEARSASQALEVIPSAAKWQQLVAMGEFIFKSSLCPAGLKSANDVTIILMAANDLGISLSQAVDKIFVTNGRKGMAAELMRALIRRDGHTLRVIESNDHHCVLYGRRHDNGDEETTEFTIEEAIHAGLCARAPDGTITSRSRDGKKLPWETYTTDMLYARCTSRIGRRMFSDSLAGITYTPDELGYIDAEDDAKPKGRHGEATVTLDEQRNALAGRIQALDDDIRSEVSAEWKKKNLPRVATLSPGGLRTATALVEAGEARQEARQAEKESEVPDAETVCEFEGCEVVGVTKFCAEHTPKEDPPVEPEDATGDETTVEDPPPKEIQTGDAQDELAMAGSGQPAEEPGPCACGKGLAVIDGRFCDECQPM